jgi:hypothetical protein
MFSAGWIDFRIPPQVCLFLHSIMVNQRKLGSIGEVVGPKPNRACTILSAFQRLPLVA